MPDEPMQGNNWGRWGEDDELGSRNLITDTTVAAAANLIKSGKIYDLSVPLVKGGRLFPYFHETWRITTSGDKGDGGKVSGDVLMLHTHAGTHIDGLSHFWKDDRLWNDRDAELVNSNMGASWAGIDKAMPFVGRGVLADIAAHRGVDFLAPEDPAINGMEIEACLTAHSTGLGEGDILLVRTGWHNVWHDDRDRWGAGEPGVDTDTASWLNDQGVVAIGADTVAVEHIPSHPWPNPFHIRALRDFGIYIIENLNLEFLAADGVTEFFFVAAPLPIIGGTGSPLSPIAIV